MVLSAIEKSGGLERAARALSITPNLLTQFLEGKRLVPDSLFMQLIDLATDEEAADQGAIAQSRKKDEQAGPGGNQRA
jgi:hypothetical protein